MYCKNEYRKTGVVMYYPDTGYLALPTGYLPTIKHECTQLFHLFHHRIVIAEILKMN
jgi:hypothetical protein